MSKKIYNNITAVILAGGYNSRYNGINKAFLEIEGISLYKRTKDRLEKIFSNIIVITNTPEIFPNDGLNKYSDVIKNIGPLGGIHSALSQIKNKEAIFVIAVDMPFLDEEIIRSIVEQYHLINPDILIPRINSLIEPLSAIYKINIFSKLDYYIKNSERFAIRNFFNKVDTKYFDIDKDEQISIYKYV